MVPSSVRKGMNADKYLHGDVIDFFLFFFYVGKLGSVHVEVNVLIRTKLYIVDERGCSPLR